MRFAVLSVTFVHEKERERRLLFAPCLFLLILYASVFLHSIIISYTLKTALGLSD